MNFPTQSNSNNHNTQTGQNSEGEIVKILHDNERGKVGFIKCNGNEHYFSVNPNYPFISKIVVEAKIIFKIIPATDEKKEQTRIVKPID